MDRTQDHIDWILTTGRFEGLQGLVNGLGARLAAEGLDLMRLRMGLRTTHPLTAAMSFIWEAEVGPVDTDEAPHGLEQRSAYIGSPMAFIARERRPFRRRLSEPLPPEDHLILHELKARGGTDYYAMPMSFVEGTGGSLMFVSKAPGGFSDADITLLHQLCNALAPMAEAHSHRQLASSIATSYLGSRTGRRVLAGQITRGDLEKIEAAVLFGDIRGWTALNAERPAAEALQVANRFFEIMSDAVDQHEGEILKFTGDGVLAIFPSDGTETGRARACIQALAAGQAAHRIAQESALAVPFGIGIHYGEVLYGNVGAKARIDFTVLGQAVNIAARVEAFCGRLEASVLVSEPVAQVVATPLRQVAIKQLKGLEEPMPLYAPASF